MIRPLAVVLTLLGATSAAAQTLVFSNASVIDPTSDAPVRTATILVRDGRIVDLGRDVVAPAGARLVDARGKFALPGLWDMHAHLAALTEIGRGPERYVAHGVLGVRDMGGYADQLFALRATIRAGSRTGPELVMAGPTLNSEQPALFHRQVTSDAEARAAVRELKAAGVDFIKIHRATTREVFDAVADESRRQGLPFAGHVPLVMSWADAAAAGMRTIEHIQTIFENIQPDPRAMATEFESIADRLDGPLGSAIFATLKAHGTVFDPTLVGYEASFETVAPEVAERRRAAYGRMKAIAARAAAAGVPIITGTDVLDRHGEMLLRELERLVDIGLTPEQALRAATSSSATVANRPELGRLAIGGPASFLLLDANPLEQISNLRRLSAVVLRGRLIEGDELDTLRQ